MVQIQDGATPEPAAPTCRHHWVIESASGPTSPGRCRNCGAQKEFKNYIEAVPWGEETRPGSASRLPVAMPAGGEEEAE